ncbi:MAG TPA: acyltransferase [Tepidiformaceae bacterium]|nr:acyltransferase [Tepidiformaceae bacterium]
MIRAQSILSHLSRRTTSGQFIPEIDGLRFASITLVVLFHLCGYTAAKATVGHFDGAADNFVALLGSTGHFGVQLFFIISGFVLALPFARYRLLDGPRPQLGAYYLRRLTRLEPPYIVAMVSIFAVASLFFGVSARALAPHLAASLAYVHNLLYGTGSTINVVAWSLEVEVQFYLLAPVLALVFLVPNGVARRSAIVAAIVAIVLIQCIWPFGDRLALSLPHYLQFFLLGFLIADLHLMTWRVPSERTQLWDVLGMASWIGMIAVWMLVPNPSALFLALAFLTFCATFRGRLVRAVFCNPWIATIGGMCYSIYLLHYPIISALGRRTSPLAAGHDFIAHLLVQMVLMLPIVLIASTVFFVLVERPCMRKDWPQRLVARFRTVWLSRTPAGPSGEPDAHSV